MQGFNAVFLLLQMHLDSRIRKRLEYEFHSACYHTLMEVIAGLRTSISHLIKEVSTLVQSMPLPLPYKFSWVKLKYEIDSFPNYEKFTGKIPADINFFQVSVADFDVEASGLLQKTLPLYLAGLYEYDPLDLSKDVFHEIGIHGYVCLM